MDSTGDVELTLSGKLTYSEAITLAQAADILSYLTSGDSAVNAPGRGAAGGPGGGVASRSARQQTGLSPKEALEASGAKINPEKIVAFAVLVSQQSGKDTFTLDDVRPLFRQAREATPGNLSRDLDAAIRSGYVAEAENKGEYYVMDKALNVLETGFEGLRNSRGSRSSSSARKPRKPMVAPEALKNLELTPTIDGFINYHKVKTKTDKYLWALNAAKLAGADAVEPSDVAWLTDRLGEGVSRNDLNSYFKGNQKRGYVNKNGEGKVRITPAGIVYLQGLAAEAAK
ncbi:hypothetical protein [Kribbella sp.]|uniref:hypothetical protein n=1 Tax=Kribbella sp. TaxID=1871183 RepID=UPI002D34C11A|nr:hypothetical protein [Kribbella sp.]HZX04417.1 hypothetical protein [Kribbella sp.]